MATVLSLSLVGSLLSVILLAGRFFLKDKVSKTFSYYIWLIVLLRFVLPITAPVNVMDTLFSYELERADTRFVENSNMQTVIIKGQTNVAPEKQTNTNVMIVEPKTPTQTDNFFEWWGLIQRNALWVWSVGAAISIGWFILAYFCFSRRIRRDCVAPHQDDSNIFEELRGNLPIKMAYSSLVSAPVLIGIYRPLIVLPQFSYVQNGMVEELHYILHHELVHYRRKDILYKWAVVIVTSLHWFNPLMLWFRKEIERACELSCDEAVISGLSESERQFYGNTLLSLASDHKVPSRAIATTLCEGKKELKERLKGIMDYKKKSTKMIVLMTFLTLLLASGAVALGTVNLAEHSPDQAAGSETGSVPFVGYENDASIDTIDVYTEENGAYIMSLPWSIVDEFPASDRNYPGWQAGWMEGIDIYCGTIHDFSWAVICSGPSAGTGTANVCTSTDGGKTWWIGSPSSMYSGTVTGAGFASSKVGFMSYRCFLDNGPEISRTLDGGKTWERMMVDKPSGLEAARMTPLVPCFIGKNGTYPIIVSDNGTDYESIASLVSADGGLTWQWDMGTLPGAQQDIKTSDLIDNLITSIEYSENNIYFQIPMSFPDPEKLNIHIAGRATYDDGFSRSIHFLEAENEAKSWAAGTSYFIPFEESYTELTMDIYYLQADGTTSEKNVDLLHLAGLFSHDPTISFYDENMVPIQGNANWCALRAHTILLVHFDGVPDTISVFFTPSGTETVDQQVLLKTVSIKDTVGGLQQIELDLGDSILGHLEVLARYGNEALYSEYYNVYYDK